MFLTARARGLAHILHIGLKAEPTLEIQKVQGRQGCTSGTNTRKFTESRATIPRGRLGSMYGCILGTRMGRQSLSAGGTLRKLG